MHVDDLLIVSESEAAEMAVREAISARLTLKIHRHDQPFTYGGRCVAGKPGQSEHSGNRRTTANNPTKHTK